MNNRIQTIDTEIGADIIANEWTRFLIVRQMLEFKYIDAVLCECACASKIEFDEA